MDDQQESLERNKIENDKENSPDGEFSVIRGVFVYMNLEDKFNINLNQNVWILIVGFLSLGFSEYYELGDLEVFAAILSGLALLSVTITLIFYTVRYCKNKL